MATAAKGPYVAPTWAHEPQLTKCGLEVFKKGKLVETLKEVQTKKCIIFGRNKEMCDVTLQHPSISRQHVALVHGSSGNIYVVDLGSSHGSTLNKKPLKKEKREVLRDGDVIQFGASTREYHVRLRLDDGSDDESEDEDIRLKEARREKKRHRDREAEEEKVRAERAAKKRAVESESDDGGSPKLVRCRHILVKHEDSRRAHSWKSSKITRSMGMALDKVNRFRKQIKAARDPEEEFMTIAKAESDCNSAKRGGDLGEFGKGRMLKPFDDAVFNLKRGQLSRPVETQSGIHLIYRY